MKLRRLAWVAVALLCAAVPFGVNARHGRGIAGIASPNSVMGINMLAGQQYSPIIDGFPIFKNRVRESLGFGTTTNGYASVTLTAAGWPATDFQENLFAGNQQSWSHSTSMAPFTCGFIGTGSETITATTYDSNTVVSNISHGMGGAYTTFNLYDTTTVGSPVNFGFFVTGTTGGVTNVFCYLPEYPGSTIDNPTTAAAFTTEAVTFYKQFAFLRLMWPMNALYDTQQLTAANRHTPSNTQSYPLQWVGVQGNIFALTAVPAMGATSATLSTAWQQPTSKHAALFACAGGTGCFYSYEARNVTLTNGSAAISWSNGLSQPAMSSHITVSPEGIPLEWMIALANATGTMGLWINTPAYEDGTDGGPGSYSGALLSLLASTYTSSGKVYFERGNENFWNGYYPTPILQNLFAVAAGSYSDTADYMAAGTVLFANLARVNLPAGWWGTKVFQVDGQQAANGNGPYYTSDFFGDLSARTSGNPSSDVQYVTIAPYVDPIIGPSDSVATIEANVSTWLATGEATWAAEQTDIAARSYGAGMVSYESGIQWNVASGTTNANAGLAIMDSGMTAPLAAIYQAYANEGFQAHGHFGTGVNVLGGYISPENELSNVYSTLISSGSPTLAALQEFEGGQTPMRNVVAASGAVVQGYNWADNFNATDCTLSNSVAAIPNLAFFANGNCLYRIYNPSGISHTYAVTVTFSGASGSPTSNLVVNGTTVATGVAVTNGVVVIGNATLTPGDNFIVLGKNSTQSATVTQIQFN